MNDDVKARAERAIKYRDDVMYKATRSRPSTAFGLMTEHLLKTTGDISLESLKAGFEAAAKGESDAKAVLGAASVAALEAIDELTQPSN